VRPAARGTNQDSVRLHNLSTLLRHLHLSGRLSRSALVTAMGLNRSTIAGLVNQLVCLGLVEQLAPEAAAPSTAGRPSVEVVTTDRACVLAVEVRVSGVVVARVGLGGVLLAVASGRSPGNHDPGATADLVAELARTVLREADPDSVLVGVGVSVPGIVAPETGIVLLAPNLEWRDVPFADLLATRLSLAGCPVLGNDADLGALAEHRRGAGRGIDDLVYLYGEVGVGAGLIAAGASVTGTSGFAGEIGHVPFGDGTRPCHCGARGCWETEIGAAAIAEAVGCPSDRLIELDRYLTELGSAPAELAVVGRHLGRGLAGLANLLNPRVVVLGGYLGELYRWVELDVQTELALRTLRVSGMAPRITLPRLGDHSVLTGAAEVAFQSLLEDPAGGLASALPLQKIE
jgi:predicted NBD/HSP70 family sugar kinase